MSSTLTDPDRHEPNLSLRDVLPPGPWTADSLYDINDAEGTKIACVIVDDDMGLSWQKTAAAARMMAGAWAAWDYLLAAEEALMTGNLAEVRTNVLAARRALEDGR